MYAEDAVGTDGGTSGSARRGICVARGLPGGGGTEAEYRTNKS